MKMVHTVQKTDSGINRISQTFKENLPLSCHLRQFGSDEFILVLPKTNRKS